LSNYYPRANEAVSSRVKTCQKKSLERIILEERISSAFITDSGGWSVAGIDNSFIRQNHEFFMNALHQTFVAATGKVGPANAEIK
jgi:hypothetical protein